MAKRPLPDPKKLRLEFMDGRVDIIDAVSVWAKPEEMLTGVRKLDGNRMWFPTMNIRGYQWITEE